MKKLTIILAILLIMTGCTKEMQYPEYEQVTVELRFDRFVNYTTSGFTAATEFTNDHPFSTSTNVNVQAIPTNKDLPIVEVDYRMDAIKTASLSLLSGVEYKVQCIYDRTIGDELKSHDDGLAFDAVSQLVTITPETTSISLTTSTDQSLILIDKEGTDSTYISIFSNGEMSDVDSTKVKGWQMFDSEYFWYLYLTPKPEHDSTYFFRYKPLTSSIPITVSFPNGFVAEEVYLISAVEEGNTTLTFDTHNLFGNVTVVGN